MFYICKNTIPLRFETHASITEVESLWREFLPENHHFLSPDVKATEFSRPEDIEFRYVQIYNQDTLIGVMYLQCLRFNSKHYNHSIFERPVIKHLKEIIKKQNVHILICGNLFRVNFQGFYFKNKADRELIFDCLHLYRQQNQRENTFSGILIKDCSREFSAEQATCYTFKPFKQDLTMELSIRKEWNQFDDYLNSLSRKYRQRANKIAQSCKNLDIREMEIPDLEIYRERINELYKNIVSKQSLALGILNSDYFLEMKKHLGDRFKVLGYFKNDELLAFSSHILYPAKNTMEIHYIGLDYEQNQKYNLYFNILFCGIRMAIEGKCKTIEMGRTAREAKANAGAHAVENFNYIWIRSGIIRLLFNFLGNWFDSSIGDEWKKRNPFKTNHETAELSQELQK